MIVQVPWIILPTLVTLVIETVNDLVEHTSIEFPVAYLQEKEIHIVATEVILAPGIPGSLNCWVELSPWPSVNNLMWPAPLPALAGYWAAIGVPLVEVATGVPNTVHALLIPWAIHSAWARLVIRTPIAAALPNAFWILQAIVSGKG